MTPLIILAAIAGVPILLALLFRVNAVFLFLSVAAGSLLVMSVSDDADLALGMVTESGNTAMMARLGLQLVPVALTLLLMRKTVAAHKIFLQIVPIVATGLMLAALTLPLLPADIQKQVFDSSHGDLIERTQDVVIGAAAVLALLLAWFSYRHNKGEGKGKRK